MTRRVVAIVFGVAVLAALLASASVRSYVAARVPALGGGVPTTAIADGSGGRQEMAPAQEPAGTPRAPVTLDTRRQQLIGVRTARVQRVMLAPEVRAVGTVRYDETRLTDINVRVDGWIRDLQADFTGKAVRSGEPLFSLYSPELIATQDEYLLAVHQQTMSGDGMTAADREFDARLVAAARERLRRFDMPPEDLEALTQGGVALETVVFRSPVSGVVIEKTAVEGMYVTAGQALLRIADLSVVWIEADIYEQDVSVVTIDAYPGRRFAGRATYIYPTVEPQTRTVRVRFQFANPRGELKPGMYANVLLAGTARSALTVPADAILDSGTDQVVFLALGDGYFEPRPVTAGRRIADAIEILDGLQEGDEVADGATFFLDSESQLRAAVRGFEAPPSPQASTSAPRERLDITFGSDPDPLRAGDNILEVSVKDQAGQPLVDADVSVTFFMAAMPSMSMPAMRNQATLPHVAGGVYRGSGQVLMAGRWDVTVAVTRGGQPLDSRQLSVVAR
jgi:RND family efflux transporter MFP subunit